MLPAHAGSGSEAADNSLILISSALVLLMTPGLAFFYGGFVQGRNVLNTMGMSLVMMGIATLVWVSVGFSLAFADGGSMNAVIGDPLQHAMLNNLAGNWDGLTIPGMTFALFQGMFAIITPALISGALVERLSFRFWCLFTPFWLLLVYAPPGPHGVGRRFPRKRPRFRRRHRGAHQLRRGCARAGRPGGIAPRMAPVSPASP